jgi:hypothetical protein
MTREQWGGVLAVLAAGDTEALFSLDAQNMVRRCRSQRVELVRRQTLAAWRRMMETNGVYLG